MENSPIEAWYSLIEAIDPPIEAVDSLIELEDSLIEPINSLIECNFQPKTISKLLPILIYLRKFLVCL
ncbi:hypothetical protein V7121_11015 [Neobacillus drentensis]|uniref:hypothetical protein n=1 Tax=Neobacillus drentensis TaxID=220684 RepID=UPI003000FA20